MSADSLPRDRAALALVAAAALLVSIAGGLVHGVPIPFIHDEFSYLFAAETFARLRLASPPPPEPEAFFSPYILVEPAFASKYPPAQGLFLATGAVLGLPILGVWLSGALAAAALLWCARALLPLRLALATVAVFAASALFAGSWVQSYWGGFVTFAGGALVLGFFLRLRAALPPPGAFIVLGAGLALLALSRPFEGALLCLSLAVVFAKDLTRAAAGAGASTIAARGMLAVPPVLAAAVFLVCLNVAVTGSPLRLPYTEFQDQYMEVPIFRWQTPVPPQKTGLRIHALELTWEHAATWPAHVASTFAYAWRAGRDVGGELVPWLAVLGALVTAGPRWQLTAAALLFVALRSQGSFIDQPHYYSPALPVLFLWIGMLPAFLARRYRWPAVPAAVVMTLLVAVSVWPRLVHGMAVPGGRPRQEIVDFLSPRGPSLVLVRYDEALSANTSIVYNDPDLRNRVLFANYLDHDTNCRVVGRFPEREVVIATLEPSALQLERSDLRSRCK